MLQAVKKINILLADGTQISGNNSPGRTGSQKLFFSEKTHYSPQKRHIQQIPGM